MTTDRRLSRLLTVLGLSALSAGLSAHHSLVAGYAKEISELEGELVAVSWRNPHIRMTLRVVNEGGETELWSMDANSIYNLQREGITRELFDVGGFGESRGTQVR